MRQGFTVHHNGLPTRLKPTDPHSKCQAFWKGVRDYHMGHNGWSDIAYSFGICHHGIRFVGRGWDKHQFANGDDEVGPDDDENGPWYSVLMFVGGGYEEGSKWVPEEKPTAAMDDCLGRLITEGRRSGRCGKRVKPHSDWRRKPCPGPHYTNYCRRHDNRDIATEQPPKPKEWDEMATKAEIEAAVESGVKKALADTPGSALGVIMARLTRELKAPSSEFRQALIEAVQEDAPEA